MVPEPTGATDDALTEGDLEEVEHLETVEDLIAHDPLIRLFGDHPRTRILMVLIEATRPLNPTDIIDMASIARKTFYNHRDELIATGMMIEVAKAGNSPLYALPMREDDLRTEWLEKLGDFTGEYLRSGGRPLPDE